MNVDSHGTGTTSNLNGVLESGETVIIEPNWLNSTGIPLTFTGAASNISGPGGPAYSIGAAVADYGSATPGSVTDCWDATASHDCYQVTVSGARPAPHWDATFDETLSLGGAPKSWTLHVGESFTDVPVSQQFYRFIEDLFHNGITGGCGVGLYCPTSSITRAQMAVFLLKAEHGVGYVPPACSGTFPDVACPSLFADWIEELSAEGITSGCGSGDYLPGQSRHARADGGVDPEDPAWLELHAAGLPGDLLRRAMSEPVRQLDRTALHGGRHRRLRSGDLLPDESEHARPDGGLHRQDVRAAAVRAVNVNGLGF